MCIYIFIYIKTPEHGAFRNYFAADCMAKHPEVRRWALELGKPRFKSLPCHKLCVLELSLNPSGLQLPYL